MEQSNTSEITFEYADGTLRIDGTFVYDAEAVVEAVTVLGEKGSRKEVHVELHKASTVKV